MGTKAGGFQRIRLPTDPLRQHWILQAGPLSVPQTNSSAPSLAARQAEGQSDLRCRIRVVGDQTHKLASYLVAERHRALATVQMAREAIQDVELLREQLATVKGRWAAANAPVAGAAMTG